MRQKVNLITLGVSDIKRSLKFYEEGLGWVKSNSSLDDLALFPLGGITLALYPRPELAEEAHVKNEHTGFPNVVLSYNAKSEQEVDEVIHKVELLGATVLKKPQKVFWGGYGAYFKDLDGHIFEVAHNPFWELDENDNLKL